jgi:hypothetical protein
VERGTEVYRVHVARDARRYPQVPAYGTVEEVVGVMETLGVVQSNSMMLTYSGRYYGDALPLLPDDPSRREARDRELRAWIVDKIIENNEWALRTAKEQPISFFCGIDPVLMDEKTLMAEVVDKTTRVALGVKTAPAGVGALANDRRWWPVYAYCHERDLPILTATSGHPSGNGRPANFAEVLKEFPRLKLIFSHLGYDFRFGQGADAEAVELAGQYENVCADLSIKLIDVASGKVTPEDFVGHLRRFGTDRLMYGSNFPYVEFLDYPMEQASGSDAQPQTTGVRASLETFLALPLSDGEREQIASKNFRRITELPSG